MCLPNLIKLQVKQDDVFQGSCLQGAGAVNKSATWSILLSALGAGLLYTVPWSASPSWAAAGVCSRVPQSRGAGGEWGRRGVPALAVCLGRKLCTPQQPARRDGKGAGQQHVVPLAPDCIQAPLRGIRMCQLYSPIASPNLFCNRLFSGKESRKWANLGWSFIIETRDSWIYIMFRQKWKILNHSCWRGGDLQTMSYVSRYHSRAWLDLLYWETKTDPLQLTYL